MLISPGGGPLPQQGEAELPLMIEARPCMPHAIAQQVLSELAPKASEKGVGLALVADGAVAETITSDAARMRQVLVHLIGNAIRFTGQGGVSVALRCTGTHYQVEVRDSGIGIAADRLETLFQPLSRADGSNARSSGGTGLGLAFGRKLARALGGDLTASSEPGIGTVMRFTCATGPLAGVRMLAPTQVLATLVGAVTAPQGLVAGADPIHSRFAQDPRLAPIVAKFAARLRERLEQARQSYAQSDFDELGRFGHWLAGSAGTMGYDGLTAPARSVEALAIAGDLHGLEMALSGLDAMCDRLVVPEPPAAS